MDRETLEESLDELFPGGYVIEIDEQGQLIIHTGLQEDEDENLIPLLLEEDEEIDSDFEPLADDDED